MEERRRRVSCPIELAFAALMMPMSRCSRSSSTNGRYDESDAIRVRVPIHLRRHLDLRAAEVIHKTKRHLSPRPDIFTHLTHLLFVATEPPLYPLIHIILSSPSHAVNDH